MSFLASHQTIKKAPNTR